MFIIIIMYNEIFFEYQQRHCVVSLRFLCGSNVIDNVPTNLTSIKNNFSGREVHVKKKV